MKALLLAAGLGTRLKPFTFTQAKASLPFLNAPLIHYPLQYLSANGIEEAIINLHAHPESVRKVAGNEFHGMKIEYSHEPQILGTAGAMAKASSLLGSDSFVVMNSDMLCDIPIKAVWEQHKLTGNMITLVITIGERPGYNPLHYDPQTLKITHEGLKCHYTGLQIVDRSVVDNIPSDRKTEVFRDVYPELIDRQTVGVFLYDGLWMEMGTLQEFFNCSKKIIESPLPGRLSPPKMQLSLVSKEAKIESGSVTDTIIMDGSVIREDVKLQRCIVGPDLHVKKSYVNAALARGILPWYF
jgi:NDP-sugar pyrophosphorylase family protein